MTTAFTLRLSCRARPVHPAAPLARRCATCATSPPIASAVPGRFFGRIELVDHRKAADYTAAKVRLGLLEIVVDALVLLALTLGGVLG
jgi:hypothetical protein